MFAGWRNPDQPDEKPDPIDVELFGGQAVMLVAQALAHLIKQAEFGKRS